MWVDCYKQMTNGCESLESSILYCNMMINTQMSAVYYLGSEYQHVVYHDHVCEKSRYIDAESHVGNNSLDNFTLTFHVALDIDIFEELLTLNVTI